MRLVLHQLQESPFCDKIRRALNWKGLPYTVHEVPLLEALTTLKKVNPIGKVPALEVDGRVVADSTDIAYYLEERWPEPPLLPRDPAERALCHFLEDWADESLYFYEMRLRFTFARNRARWTAALLEHDNALVRSTFPPIVARAVRKQCEAQGMGRKPEAMVLRDVDRHLEALTGWLAGKTWLVGSALSLADLAVFAQLRCIDCAEEGHARVAAKPSVVEWMARVAAATSAAGSATGRIPAGRPGAAHFTSPGAAE
jgi:glutathione S-transferase